jgi:peptidylprolyl isomerase
MRLRYSIVAALAALSMVGAGCSEEEATNKTGGDSTADLSSAPPSDTTAAPETAPARSKPKIAKPTGAPPKKLVKEDLIVGKGSPAAAGDQLKVNYVGVSFKSGKEFDSSFKAGQAFEFQLGGGEVIPGWDQGIEGMRVGGRRKLTIPPDLAYGPEGSPPAIGPNETLVFVIDLLAKQ